MPATTPLAMGRSRPLALSRTALIVATALLAMGGVARAEEPAGRVAPAEARRDTRAHDEADDRRDRGDDRRLELRLRADNGEKNRQRLREWPADRDFVILSFDGGGIKGVLSAALLQRIAEARPGFLDRVDAVAGTSTGAIVAAGIAAGLEPSKIVDLYAKRGGEIFARGTRQKLRSMSGLAGAKYSAKNLEKILVDTLGDTTLEHLEKPILVPVYDLRSDRKGGGMRPEFFKTFTDRDDTKVVDVLRRTTAAPTFFPSEGRFVDGGVAANDPALAAVFEAINAGIPPERIKVLSIGTGETSHAIGDGKSLDWGLLPWASNLPGLLLGAPSKSTEYGLRQLLQERYVRLSPTLDREISLDDVSQIPYLVELGKTAPLEDPGIASLRGKLKARQQAFRKDARRLRQEAKKDEAGRAGLERRAANLEAKAKATAQQIATIDREVVGQGHDMIGRWIDRLSK